MQDFFRGVGFFGHALPAADVESEGQYAGGQQQLVLRAGLGRVLVFAGKGGKNAHPDGAGG